MELQDGVDIELLENMELDRSDDDVYNATTTVISTVMNMTQTATDKNVHLYVPLVKVRIQVCSNWQCRRLKSSFCTSREPYICLVDRLIRVMDSTVLKNRVGLSLCGKSAVCILHGLLKNQV